MSERLFVYGTLQRGRVPQSLGAWSRGWRWCGPASVPGELYDFGDYPGARLEADPDSGSRASRRVHGELVDLPRDAALWRALDAYEGCCAEEPETGLFRRQRCRARTPGGREEPAWIYVCQRDPREGRLLPDGRWRGAGARP